MATDKIFLPPNSEPLRYAQNHLQDCLGHPCPTGYLAAGYVTMNKDLKEAYDIIKSLRNQLESHTANATN